MKHDNEQRKWFAMQELMWQRQQQTQLEALSKRIQRGREEHKEHWLQGAQRLMQSHKNMISDLKTKQVIENLRASTSVQLDMSASRANLAGKSLQNIQPRVYTGKKKTVPQLTPQPRR